MKLTEVYKITPKKSLTLEFSENIPEHLIKYFILGYFDGDGSVCCYKPKSSPNVNLDFSILGTNNMMNHFKNHINKHVPEAKGSIFKQQNYYVLSISGTKSAIYFGEWLFSDTDFPINLKRKQEKFTNYVKEWGFLKTAKRGSGFGKNKNLSI
jgi:intein-encoded DNA endonuclease-like protein